MLKHEWKYYCFCDKCGSKSIEFPGVRRDTAVKNLRALGWRMYDNGYKGICPKCCAHQDLKNISNMATQPSQNSLDNNE